MKKQYYEKMQINQKQPVKYIAYKTIQLVYFLCFPSSLSLYCHLRNSSYNKTYKSQIKRVWVGSKKIPSYTDALC